MEVRWPKVSAAFLGDGSAGGSACFGGSAWRKPAGIVFSSDSYMLAAENWGAGAGGGGGGAPADDVAAPRKSSNLGPPAKTGRLLVAPPTTATDASTALPKIIKKIDILSLVISTK